jgi:hypothetical protein
MSKYEALKIAGYDLDGVIADVEKFDGFDDVCLQTIKRVRSTIAKALEQPAQEPKVIVSPQNDRILFQDTTNGKYMMVDVNSNLLADIISSQLNKFFDEIYTHPHQWQGLTDDEIDTLEHNDFTCWGRDDLIVFGRAIEQALKEKNHV